ncbi:MAG TPA: HipA domain-containing protein [Bacteroidales bacterium]|nr:HipA domain-containing protein [Bacteroidales bacterium]
MAETVNLLNVLFIDNRRIGKLALSPDRRCLFEYDPGWIATGFSVSPFYLPLKSGLFTARAEPFGGMFGVFDDSLPDGWGKLLVDRWLISRGINPASISLLERLSIVGENGMGALVYRPAKESSINEEVHPLSFYALEVEKIFRQMVFNILISNKDDHAKNFSFIYINGYWAVSPAYDLLPSDGFNGNHSTTVNGKGQPSLTDCEEVAKNISLPLKIAARIIAEVKENL